jgi:hypothetical protein
MSVAPRPLNLELSAPRGEAAQELARLVAGRRELVGRLDQIDQQQRQASEEVARLSAELADLEWAAASAEQVTTASRTNVLRVYEFRRALPRRPLYNHERVQACRGAQHIRSPALKRPGLRRTPRAHDVGVRRPPLPLAVEAAASTVRQGAAERDPRRSCSFTRNEGVPGSSPGVGSR